VSDWRIYFYPLGFLAAFAFGLRFLVQWIASEKAGRSVVSSLFWQVSLAGNMLLLIHSFIQMQYPMSCIQCFNAVIAWRNLDLMQTQREPRTLAYVVKLLIFNLIILSLLFAWQWWFVGDQAWYRIPIAPWQDSQHANDTSLLWHICGIGGWLLFSSRFWMQWWWVEKDHVSELPSCFWWLSLAGALCSIAYAIKISDSVNLIGPAFGLIVYIRNLMLIYKTSALTHTSYD